MESSPANVTAVKNRGKSGIKEVILKNKKKISCY